MGKGKGENFLRRRVPAAGPIYWDMMTPEQTEGPTRPTPDDGADRRPEEIIYRHCYAPVDLKRMLASADTRSKIRRLPGPQLYFGLQELSHEEIAALLPHITEEQWTAVLDLDLWSRDRVQLTAFAAHHRHLVTAQEAVARKLLRGVDRELWQLLFRRKLKVYRRDENQFEGVQESEEDWLVTPDEGYLVSFPDNPELAAVLRPLLLRLYQLDAEATRLDLESALARTSLELEEEAYQRRKRRIEDLGFQDYFDALSIYTGLDPNARFPRKDRRDLREISTLPTLPAASGGSHMLLFRALDRLRNPRDVELLLEEVAFVANKVLSADRVSPSSPERVKRGVRKALCGINLGLDVWSQGDPAKAEEGIQDHYLQSFFQCGYGRLMDLQHRIRPAGRTPAVPGSFEEAVIEGLLKPYPLRTVKTPKGLRRRFFENLRQLEFYRRKLDRLVPAG